MTKIKGNFNHMVLLLIIPYMCLQDVIVSAKLVEIQQSTPLLGGAVTFLAVGDWGRKGEFNQSMVARQMGVVGAKLGAQFVVSTGDNFYPNGLTASFDPAFAQSFTNIYNARSLQKPWYAILGNHDYHGNVSAQLNPMLTNRDKRWNCYRSFIVRAGFVHLFFIDTNPFVDKYFINQSEEKFNWKGVLPRETYISNLLKDLTLALQQSKAVWKIVIGHHPIRSIGSHGDTTELIQKLLPILEANKVPIYINGHEHCLERINNTGTIPMEFLTSGGGSKAWKNDTHFERYKNNLKFYHAGQGFISAQFTKRDASIVFYDVSGTPVHNFKLNATIPRAK